MLPGFATEASGEDGELVTAARTTIDALREQHAIQPWHELDCAIVTELTRGIAKSRPGSVAYSQMANVLLQARAKLPEPMIAETDETVQMEADRVDEWLRAHTDPAHVPDEADTAPVQ